MGPRALICRVIILATSSTARRMLCFQSLLDRIVAEFMAKIDAFFNLMFEQKASDLHLSSGNQPMLRINGELHRVDYPPLENDELKKMLYEIAPEFKTKIFEETGDVDFGYEILQLRRFRVNFFNQKHGVAAAFRQIPSKVLSFEDFEKMEVPLPAVLEEARHAQPRAGGGDRPDRVGQIHDPGGHGGLCEQEPPGPHYHH